MTGSKRVLLPIVLVLWGLAGSRAVAQDEMSMTDATAALESGNQGNVEIGIQSLGLIGDKAALDVLMARVRRGLPRDLLLTAIFTVGAIGDHAAGPLLIDLTRHRSPEVRARAIEMLAALQPPDAAAALMQALADPDPDVRAIAAIGLGDMGASEALDKLFQAQDRGVTEASVAIGKVVSARDVPRLLEYLGRMPLRALAPALRAIITRANVDENARLQVVSRLSELATPEVKAFLKEVLDVHGTTLPARLRTALSTAAQQIAD